MDEAVNKEAADRAEEVAQLRANHNYAVQQLNADHDAKVTHCAFLMWRK
jgi:hypothetical protein